MHSYRETFQDNETDRFANSSTFGGGGGENLFHIPYSPYPSHSYNTHRLTLPKTLDRNCWSESKLHLFVN